MASDAGSDATRNGPIADAPSALAKEEKNLEQLAYCHYALGMLTGFSALMLFPYLLSAYEAAYWTGEAPLSDRTVQLMSWLRYMPGLEDPMYDEQILGLTLLMALLPSVVLFFMHGIVLATVGRWLSRRRKYKTTIIFSWFHLTNIPVGTAISALTLVTLRRPAVKQLYGLKPKSTKDKAQA